MNGIEGNSTFYIRALGAALACLAVAGCVGGSQTVKPDYRFNSDERKGLGVFSVEVDDQCGKNTPVIHYHATGSTNEAIRELELDKETKGNAASFLQGWFFVQEEAPGDYIFADVSYGKDVKATISQDPVKFTNGRVTYLGALQVSIPNCQEMNVTISDKSQRDLVTFTSYMAHFKSKYVMTQIIGSR